MDGLLEPARSSRGSNATVQCPQFLIVLDPGITAGARFRTDYVFDR